MKAHPAQPSAIDAQVVQQLRKDAEMLAAIAILVESGRSTPKNREDIRRNLAGIIARCESLRQALK